ncbi:MAG: thermonuclease family protein [Thermodesulfobacteriota bacterium]
MKKHFRAKTLKRLAFLLAALTLPATPLYAWQGKVMQVIDGDTVKVARNGSIEKIRLYGIDAPEKDQPFGRKATGSAAQLTLGEVVRVEEVTRDRYGRLVATIWLGQQNINQTMVEQGYAWVYPAYCHKSFCRKWRQIEAEARAGRQGLWAAERPMPPWQWRKRDKAEAEDQLSDFIEDLFRWLRKIMAYIKQLARLFE